MLPLNSNMHIALGTSTPLSSGGMRGGGALGRSPCPQTDDDTRWEQGLCVAQQYVTHFNTSLWWVVGLSKSVGVLVSSHQQHPMKIKKGEIPDQLTFANWSED